MSGFRNFFIKRILYWGMHLLFLLHYEYLLWLIHVRFPVRFNFLSWLQRSYPVKHTWNPSLIIVIENWRIMKFIPSHPFLRIWLEWSRQKLYHKGRRRHFIYHLECKICKIYGFSLTSLLFDANLFWTQHDEKNDAYRIYISLSYIEFTFNPYF